MEMRVQLMVTIPARAGPAFSVIGQLRDASIALAQALRFPKGMWSSEAINHPQGRTMGYHHDGASLMLGDPLF